jgi:hypothetical protein
MAARYGQKTEEGSATRPEADLTPKKTDPLEDPQWGRYPTVGRGKGNQLKRFAQGAPWWTDDQPYN